MSQKLLHYSILTFLEIREKYSLITNKQFENLNFVFISKFTKGFSSGYSRVKKLKDITLFCKSHALIIKRWTSSLYTSPNRKWIGPRIQTVWYTVDACMACRYKQSDRQPISSRANWGSSSCNLGWPCTGLIRFVYISFSASLGVSSFQATNERNLQEITHTSIDASKYT